MATLKQFILKKRPQVVVVAAECREALSVVDDMKMCIAELEQENQIPTISVEALDGEVARIFTSSPRSENEFLEYPSLLVMLCHLVEEFKILSLNLLPCVLRKMSSFV